MNENVQARPGAVAAAIGSVAWGYLFFHLDINLGTLDILPNWAFYAFALSALPGLAKVERSAKLLRPLGLILLWVTVLMWVLKAIGAGLNSYLVTAVITVLELYFHFQLLTNIADIAARFDTDKARSLKRLRNFRAVYMTLFALPWPYDRMSGDAQTAFTLVMLVAAIVVIIWTLTQLFGLKKDPRLAQFDTPDQEAET